MKRSVSIAVDWSIQCYVFLEPNARLQREARFMADPLQAILQVCLSCFTLETPVSITQIIECLIFHNAVIDELPWHKNRDLLARR